MQIGTGNPIFFTWTYIRHLVHLPPGISSRTNGMPGFSKSGLVQVNPSRISLGYRHKTRSWTSPHPKLATRPNLKQRGRPSKIPALPRTTRIHHVSLSLATISGPVLPDSGPSWSSAGPLSADPKEDEKPAQVLVCAPRNRYSNRSFHGVNG
jgi:hypothetical protein